MSLLYKAQTRFLFHAHIKLKLPVFSPDSCFDKLFGVLERVDRLYNSYRKDSYIDRINRQAGSFVDVDDETVRLLKRCLHWSEVFQGGFDITIMPLIRLWGFYKDRPLRIPSPEELEQVRALVDYRQIEIDGNRVRIGRGQELITGSFLKARAVDLLVEELERMGIDDTIINAGGSTIRALNNTFHPSWTVNVRHPDNDRLMYTLRLRGKCYTTSSQKETSVIINGRSYGHILNPLTGFPAVNRQVGLVTDSCMDGDILSTGLFLQSPDMFRKTLAEVQKELPAEGFLLDDRNTVTSSSGFDRYIQK